MSVSTKAGVFYRRHRVRNHVKEWLEIHRKPAIPERAKEISSRIMVLSRFLPEPLKVQEFLHQFSENLLRDQALLLGGYGSTSFYLCWNFLM